MSTSTNFLLTAVIPSYLEAIGTIGATVVALYFGMRGIKEANEQKKVGFAMKEVDSNGVGIIVNDSQVDYIIQLSKYVLAYGTRSDIATDIQKELIAGVEKGAKKAKILQRIEDIKPEGLLLKQTLTPGECVYFSIHDMRIEEVSLVFILLKLKLKDKEKFYLYRYANRANMKLIESPLNDKLGPYNKWLKIYSFEIPSSSTRFSFHGN